MKRIILISIIILPSCNKTSKTENHTDENSVVSSMNNDEFSDGEYCAEIQYYNQNTGKHSTYTLPVEVKNGELVKIQWENGGWLDESHFTAPDISDGTASFTSDKGYKYDIELIEKGSNCSSNSASEDDEQNENEDN